MRRRRPGLVAIRAYRGPMLREGTPDPEGDPTAPPPDPTPDPATDPKDDDDDRPMTRREWKAWLAEQEKGKAEPKEEEPPKKAPAPPVKEEEPPKKTDDDQGDEVPSAWFRHKRRA